MQLSALDGASIISAPRAEKGKNYLCPECRAPLRIRSGPHRQIHFYHPVKPKNCRQHQKSEEHLQLQLKLLDLIGGAEEKKQIECPFPEIGRIADVAWHTRKIIFEIQCSPISLEEVKQRNRDYQGVGYEVIWILHEKKFNKHFLSAAESYLRLTLCYFTNIDQKGNGIVYDQFEVFKAGRRLFKGPPLNISPTQLSRLPSISSPDLALPEALLVRLSQWKYYAQGDLLHRLLQEGNLSQTANKLLTIERKLLEKKQGLKRLPLLTLIAKSYFHLLDFILKKFLL